MIKNESLTRMVRDAEIGRAGHFVNSRKQNGRLLGETRRSRMLEWLREEGSARVSELAQAFEVSEVTVRQDLEKLEADGHIMREHGGAYLKSVPTQVRAMALQHRENMEAKQRIGRTAAALVADGETIILDSGSTTTEVAANLFGRHDMTVITNALNIALMLGAEPGFDVHMTGGHFKAPTLSLSGERSADYFRGLFAQKLFLATGAIRYRKWTDLPVPVRHCCQARHDRICTKHLPGGRFEQDRRTLFLRAWRTRPG